MSFKKSQQQPPPQQKKPPQNKKKNNPKIYLKNEKSLGLLTMPAFVPGLFDSFTFSKEIFRVIHSDPIRGESGCLNG